MAGFKFVPFFNFEIRKTTFARSSFKEINYNNLYKEMDIDKIHLEKYKRNLTPFAQKVLEQLLGFQKENASQMCGDTITSYETRPKPNNRKVIVFTDLPSDLPTCQINNKEAGQFADAVSTDLNENTIRISTSEELVSPVAVTSNCLDSGPTSYAEQYNILEAPKPHEKVNYNILEKKFSVNWNDFLDEDFFDSYDSNDSFPKNVRRLDHKDENENNLDITSSINVENYQKCEAKDDNLKDDLGETIVPTKSKKPLKSKCNAKQKIEKIERRKHERVTGFRKEKYTKAVKNWLKDVDNNVDDVATLLDAKHSRTDISEETNNKKGKEIHMKVKKIVQAQLANKGGKMKFAKPNLHKTNDSPSNIKLPAPTHDLRPPAAENNCNKDKEKPLSKEFKTVDKTKLTEKVKVKEKKTRSKFVAPVITPLPVKDVTYEIHILDQHRQENTLFKSENTAIVMVLLYSTGFNQLNCQYASTVGAPEGVMFGVGDQYYYMRDMPIFSEEMICRVISHNTLVCFNAKEVLIYLMDHYDLSSCSYNIIDLKIGASLLNPDEPPDSFTKLQKLLGNTSQFSIASECPLQKCARYMDLLRDCDRSLRGMLTDAGMWNLFSDIEMQALPIIAEMEHLGIRINEEHLKHLDITLLNHMKAVELKCYEAAGRRFQINSAPQVRNILYGELKLDQRCNVAVRETVCKAKSTSEAMLRLLTAVHPLPALVLQYRQLHKARATFVAGILQHARGAVVRPTWEQTAAVTGRIACNNPNLQAIPKTFSPGPSAEQNSDAGGSLSFRGAYVARAGRVLLAADFRHAECRVLALTAADAALGAALASPDLFAVLAAQWLGKAEGAVSGAERERTKRLVYAGLYGAGARTLADILRVREDHARAVLDSFHESFPGLRRFGADAVAAARGGRLRTAGGRARRLPQLASADRAARAHAERQAVNFIVQGSAADLCKAAMVVCGAALRRAGLAARPLLQIHDELVWELPPDQLPAAARVIKSAMEGCGASVGLPAVFPVRLSAGPSWGDLAPYSEYSQHPPTPCTSQHPPTPCTSQHPPTPCTSQHPPTPSTSQHPPTPCTSQHPPTPSTSQHPPTPSTSQHPPTPCTSQHPPTPSTSQHPPTPSTSQHPPTPCTLQHATPHAACDLDETHNTPHIAPKGSTT